MISRWYRVVVAVTLGAIWIGGSGAFGASERLILSGFVIAGLVPIMWVDTVIRSGVGCFRSVPMMARVFLRSKRGATLTGIAVVFVAYILSPYRAQPYPYRYQMSVVLISTTLLLWLQPPCVLVLGASSQQTGRALALISAISFPFRVVALLDHRKTGYLLGAFSPLTDSLRTESDSHWRTTVDGLADHVPLIVLDARADTPLVVAEVKIIMESAGRRDRTIFVCGADGRAPALEAHNVPPHSPKVQVVQEDALQVAIKNAVLHLPPPR